MVSEKMISPKDLDLIKVCDKPEEVVREIRDFYLKSNLRPNF
jgi:predicted Rossmann-fold nucleotide-binding protein